MYVKPVSGRRVADPVKGGYLPEIGRKVEPDIYWHRRVMDGDVVELSDEDGAKLQAAEEKRQLDEEAKRQKDAADADKKGSK